LKKTEEEKKSGREEGNGKKEKEERAKLEHPDQEGSHRGAFECRLGALHRCRVFVFITTCY
jgi:hypothetical protein